MDSKQPGRIRNPELMRELHVRWRECVICGETWPLSLHHISRHPRDDVEANLVMLCGSGTTGCHGLIESRDPVVSWELRSYLRGNRPDTIEYLDEMFPHERAEAWLKRILGS